jgi:hypothetical protein
MGRSGYNIERNPTDATGTVRSTGAKNKSTNPPSSNMQPKAIESYGKTKSQEEQNKKP